MTSRFQWLTLLAGRWSGRGRGQYPTIEPFEYDEETSFLAAPEYPMLRYEQRTWLRPGREESHWELGMWRALEDGEIELSTAQDSGRVEVLRGRPEARGANGFRLGLCSTFLGNDARLVRTERVLELSGDELHYAKFMATTTTAEPERIQHLEATLRRLPEHP